MRAELSLSMPRCCNCLMQKSKEPGKLPLPDLPCSQLLCDTSAKRKMKGVATNQAQGMYLCEGRGVHLEAEYERTLHTYPASTVSPQRDAF